MPDYQDRPDERKRVRSKIGFLILAQLRFNLSRSRAEFTARELELLCDEYARANGRGYAFGSATRILRDLRRDGWIDYENTSRQESKYRIVWIRDHYYDADGHVCENLPGRIVRLSDHGLYFDVVPDRPADSHNS